jgi:hypothetical protein
MKQLISITSIFLLFLSSVNLLAQEKCQVLLPQLDSIYHGRCKNGLAQGKGTAIGIDSYSGHFSKGLPSGKGTYHWANGDKYTGNWREGMRNGEGTLSLKLESKDSIISGLWENDKYMGHKPKAPKVLTKTSVDRYSFIKHEGSKKRVLFNIRQNGGRNVNIFNFTMVSTSGVETKLGNLVGYEFIEFPVKIKVNYETLNKLKAAKYQVIFEFEITEPGDWEVFIHN